MDTSAETVAFDEAYYLETNPDVAQSVAAGAYPSGWAHFLAHGRSEGRRGSPATNAHATPPQSSAPSQAAPSSESHSFDEAWYLENNPDIAQAVANGVLGSGYEHWLASGRAEGRIAPPGYDEGVAIDADWYPKAYPLVPQEIAAGRATDAAHHYATLGRFRGYLPNRYAPRPDNPAGIASRFGGLWPDAADAMDLIEGRLEIGRITPDQATLLRAWVTDGYVVLRQAIAPAVIDRAAEELQRAYDGQIEHLRFECPTIGGHHPVPWDPAVRTKPAKALDLHWLSQPIRDLIFAPPIREYLELIFERRAMASQSLTFLRGSSQGYHQDTVYVPFSLPTQFVASWVALEDVVVGGGELTYFPGSHRIPEYLYADRFKTLWEAQRMLRRNSLREEMRDYSDRLEARSRAAGLEPSKFMARKGDVLLWHADLAHGGLPISVDKTRASVVTHYCPKEVAPLTFERGGTAVQAYRNGSGQDLAWYATGYYAGQPQP